MASQQHQIAIVTAMTVLLICAFFMGVGVLLFYLHWRNSHRKPEQMEKLRSKRVKFLIFILKDVLLELIGLASFIWEVVGFQTPGKWKNLHMHQIEIAFYVFQSFKYALLIFSIITERYEELDDKIATKLARYGIRADWKELLEGLIFIPSVVIDGMLLNAEFFVADFGNTFNGDGVVMLTIDTLLWVKLCTNLLLLQYSAKGHPPYQVKEFAYALAIFFYSVLLVFFFIVEHQRVISVTGMSMTSPLYIILINALTHHYVCSYSSMMAQGILMFDKALRGSTARVKQLKMFIRYLRIAPIPIIFTLGFLGYSLWVYISVWVYSMDGHVNLINTEATEGIIRGIYIMVEIFTTFFLAHLGYAILKRFGAYFNIQTRIFGYKFPDCSAYAEQINGILGQCTANFRLDSRGQIVGTR